MKMASRREQPTVFYALKSRMTALCSVCIFIWSFISNARLFYWTPIFMVRNQGAALLISQADFHDHGWLLIFVRIMTVCNMFWLFSLSSPALSYSFAYCASQPKDYQTAAWTRSRTAVFMTSNWRSCALITLQERTVLVLCASAI